MDVSLAGSRRGLGIMAKVVLGYLATVSFAKPGGDAMKEERTKARAAAVAANITFGEWITLHSAERGGGSNNPSAAPTPGLLIMSPEVIAKGTDQRGSQSPSATPTPGLLIMSPEKIVTSTLANRPAMCMESIESLEGSRSSTFSWASHQEPASISSGTCSNVKDEFGLCDHSPPRECLLSRVPWQTSVDVVRCCFYCCMMHWQKHLGLVHIYKHWFSNPAYTNTQFDGKLNRHVVPPLDSVVLHQHSVNRFSIFLWTKGHRLSAEQFAVFHGGAGVIGHGHSFFDSNTTHYANSHPVSFILQSDSDKGPSREKIEKYKLTLPGGARFFTTNGGGDMDSPTPSIPLGAASKQFEELVRKNSANHNNRTSLLMCCCQTDRGDRYKRMEPLVAPGGACTDDAHLLAHVGLGEYAERLTRSKFVLSMKGNGNACFRDMETIVAGSVPVLDGYCSGGKALWDDSVPALHIPDCGNRHVAKYCDPGTLTREFLTVEYAKLEGKRQTLNVQKAFWPYWLYHVFLPVPENSQHA